MNGVFSIIEVSCFTLQKRIEINKVKLSVKEQMEPTQ